MPGAIVFTDRMTGRMAEEISRQTGEPISSEKIRDMLEKPGPEELIVEAIVARLKTPVGSSL
ncbi:MAG: hypothetical protein V1705_01705 [bacterium]